MLLDYTQYFFFKLNIYNIKVVLICWSCFFFGWGDVIQVDSWMYRSGRNGFRRDWLNRDLKTGKTLIRATRLTYFYHFITILLLLFYTQ